MAVYNYIRIHYSVDILFSFVIATSLMYCFIGYEASVTIQLRIVQVYVLIMVSCRPGLYYTKVDRQGVIKDSNTHDNRYSCTGPL